MRRCMSVLLAMLMLVMMAGCSSYTDSTATTVHSTTASAGNTAEEKDVMLRIRINNTAYTAHFCDTDAAAALGDMLPMTIGMSDLNGNEKYCYLDQSLPTLTTVVGRINAGDIMLYGDDCLVLFYDSFDTVYSYTRIGHIDDPHGLADALGRGEVTLTIEQYE